MPDLTEHRFLMVLHYDGSDFFGWQRQKTERTVQGEVESVLERIAGRHCPVMGSGRTDRGVHALGQVASVLLPDRWDAPALRSALNALLHPGIWVQEVRRVDLGFHPRYDAVERSYSYLVGTSPFSRSPFLSGRCWALARSLDVEELAEAAAALVGEHSYEAFAKAGQEERGYRCTVHRAAWGAWESLGHVFTITANRYLHHMVRYLVGTMVEIALGKRPRDDLSALLSPGSSGLETSPPAPPEGLYLTRVRYREGADAALEEDRDGAPGVASSILFPDNHLNKDIGESE